MKYNNILLMLFVVMHLLINNNIFSGDFKTENNNRVKQVLKNITPTVNNDEREEKFEKNNRELIESFKVTPKVKLSDLKGKLPTYIELILKSSNPNKNKNLIENILLYGPPGTGKSTIAEVLAYEMQRDFYKVSAASIVTAYQGSGSKTISSLFKKIENSAKPSVLFIDEIDLISNEKARSGSNESDSALYELQIQLDKKMPLIFIAATNKIEQMSSALKSRIQPQIEVPLPDEFTVINLLKDRANKYNFNFSDADIKAIADSTDLEKMSFRDIEDISKVLRKLIHRYNGCPANEKGKEKTNNFNIDIYKVATYMTQAESLPDIFDIFTLVEFYLNHIGAKLNDQEDFTLLFAEIAGYFKYKDIERAIEIAYNFAKKNDRKLISLMDLYAGVYYNQTVKFASTKVREKLLKYFAKNKICNFDETVFQDIAASADDNFTGKELASLIDKAYRAAKERKLMEYFVENKKTDDNIRKIDIVEISEEDMYVGLYKELKKKAKKFEIITNYKLEDVKTGSKSYNTVYSSSVSINTSNDIERTKRTDSIDIKPMFDDESEYNNICYRENKVMYQACDDETCNIRKRIEYRNKSLPNKQTRTILIKYFIKRYAHDLHEKHINEFIEKSWSLSLCSIEECIELAHAKYACNKEFLSYDDLSSACREYSIKLDVISLTDKEVQKGNCIVS
ncbi:MAG: AAA family ATPase [Novosphingobium sp.]|nr:AAA family ATPase [Novosphingobium sp.]